MHKEKGRFEYILVDEFQDTDSQQASIISRLCRDERGISKLAVVGDRQQSIYGFRGAEVEVSDDMQQLMEAEYQNATIPLDVNSRLFRLQLLEPGTRSCQCLVCGGRR